MKKILSNKITTLILLIVTILSLAFYVYMLARPISYGMNYHNKTVYAGMEFEGNMKFNTDGTVIVNNTNFDEEMKYYYYYKDGYVFSLLAQTEEEYEAEVKYIDENFEEAVASPFYAAKINAFRQVAEGLDSDVTTYTCTGAIVFAIAFGIVEFVLMVLTVLSFIFCKKVKCSE